MLSALLWDQLSGCKLVSVGFLSVFLRQKRGNEAGLRLEEPEAVSVPVAICPTESFSFESTVFYHNSGLYV